MPNLVLNREPMSLNCLGKHWLQLIDQFGFSLLSDLKWLILGLGCRVQDSASKCGGKV